MYCCDVIYIYMTLGFPEVLSFIVSALYFCQSGLVFVSSLMVNGVTWLTADTIFIVITLLLCPGLPILVCSFVILCNHKANNSVLFLKHKKDSQKQKNI